MQTIQLQIYIDNLLQNEIALTRNAAVARLGLLKQLVPILAQTPALDVIHKDKDADSLESIDLVCAPPVYSRDRNVRMHSQILDPVGFIGQLLANEAGHRMNRLGNAEGDVGLVGRKSELEYHVEGAFGCSHDLILN